VKGRVTGVPHKHVAMALDRDQGPAGWSPPPYTLRRSVKARSARLVVSPHEGLVVVVPHRFDSARVPELLATKADWIERVLARLGPEVLYPSPRVVPDEIVLAALGEAWQVSCQPGTDHRCRLELGEARLTITALPETPGEALVEPLRVWLSRRARAGLEPWLRDLAARQDLSIGSVSIRAQRTRWASCTASGDISLNRSLLFLPPELVAHVLNHELCHRHELNHSAKFRALLLQADPDTVDHERALRAAWRHVPAWAR